LFLTDGEKLVGTWNGEGIWFDVPTVLVFSANGTFRMDVKIGFGNSTPFDLSLSKGKWNIDNGILTMEIVDFIPSNNYTYQFSEDNNTLKITDIDSSTSYIFRKQQGDV
jgi:hypothetical protein